MFFSVLENAERETIIGTIGLRTNTKIETPTGRRGAGCVSALNAWHQIYDWGSVEYQNDRGINIVIRLLYCVELY